jgi:hypothetical protein
MKRKVAVIFCCLIMIVTLIGCSSAGDGWFQTNDKAAPFNLFHLFDHYPALNRAWDSVPGGMGNHKMAAMMHADLEGTAEFLNILSYLLERADNPGLGMLDDLKTLLGLVQDDSERFYGNNQKGITPYEINSFYGDEHAPDYLKYFYDFLDEITEEVNTLDTPGIGPSVIGIANKVTPYLLSKTPDELEEFMEGMYMPTFYQHIDYNLSTSGYAVRLQEGTYTTAQMIAAGLVDNDITSLKVPFGCKVTLYDDDNMTGTATVFDESSKFVGAINDTTSSIRIEKDSSDMIDLAELAAGPLAMADYPMWITEGASPGLDTLITDYASMPSGTDSGLGNMSAGMSSIMYGLINLMNGETIDREGMYDLIDNLNTVVSDPEIVKRLLWNFSNYFTEGGSVFGTLNTGNTGVNSNIYNTDNPGVLYSNVELGENLRQILTGSSGLLLRNDRRASMVWQSGSTDTTYPLATLLSNVKKIYADWDNAPIKESIYDLLRYDAYGRDRRTDANAYQASHLEHLLYVGAVSGNIGYAHKQDANEIAGADDNTIEGNMRRNGHGESLGYMTLNDSLFALGASRDGTMGADKGTYELAFDGSGVNKGKDRVFRRSTYFANGSRNSYKFQFDWNYPVLQFLSGACVGDAGVTNNDPDHTALNGGKLVGTTTPATNDYIPYSANGTFMRDLSSWSFGWVIRTCWEGEGPYYTTQGMTKSGNVYTYYRPDGKIYAYVTKDGDHPEDPTKWTYVYPVDASYDKADPASSGQRFNRYKYQWNTDYFMMRGENNVNYVPKDSDGNTEPDSSTDPQYRTYTELVPEQSADRECASHEEAIFRNFQWMLNEKKIVMVIPLWLRTTFCGEIESCLYQIMEGNGLAGLSHARKYRGNGVWAKLNAGNTRDDSVQSSIPGDFRMIFLSMPLQKALLDMGAIPASKVWGQLASGSATPAAVAHNLVALARFGFPHSPLVTKANYEHRYLGSGKTDNSANDTDAGFMTTDPVWKNRNAILPLFIALLAPIREKAYVTDPNNPSANRNSLGIMLEGLNPLVKPWVYFNYNRDSSGVAQNAWLVRARGGSLYNACQREQSVALMSDCEVTPFDWGPSTKAWYGGDAARNYFAPPALPTLLSMLIDSDTTTNRGTAARRADGLLGKLVEYDVAAGRPSVTETPWTTAPEPPDANAVNRLCYGLEQMTTGMKGAKARGTQIYEDMSNTTGTITSVTKSIDPPEWLFQKRVRPDNPAKYIDMDLDDVLEGVIGASNTEGIRQFHDGNTVYGDGTGDPNWTDITNANDDGALDNIEFLVSNFVLQTGPYAITEHVFDILDVVMQHDPSEEQVKGLLYTLGKLLAYYDGTDWLLQGDAGFDMLFGLLTTALPTIDREMGLYSDAKGVTKGETYHQLMSSSQYAMAPDGLVEYIMDKVSIDPYSSGDLIPELSQFLDSRLISDSDTVFYSTISQMLADMAELVGNAPNEEELYLLYEHYGFQRNDN